MEEHFTIVIRSTAVPNAFETIYTGTTDAYFPESNVLKFTNSSGREIQVHLAVNDRVTISTE